MLTCIYSGAEHQILSRIFQKVQQSSKHSHTYEKHMFQIKFGLILVFFLKLLFSDGINMIFSVIQGKRPGHK